MAVKAFRPALRRILLAAMLAALCFTGLSLRSSSASASLGVWDANPQITSFRQAVGGDITPVLVELKAPPAVVRQVTVEKAGQAMSMDSLKSYSLSLIAEQDTLLASLESRGVRALLRETDVTQIDGSVRHIVYRFHYLLNGFVAYVATPDLERLRALPEVAAVSEFEPVAFDLDQAIDYSLGTQATVADRRLAVYGPTEELEPASTADHPEQPDLTRNDGYEGQGMYIAVIDSGVDWRHPMFGGTGLDTPLPRVSGAAESADDNQKVVYYYALSSPGDPTDDFGHGTLVASSAAGYLVDGDTPPNFGYGLGEDGLGVGPTPNGVSLHGTAPQARILAYKVCGPAPQCPGDIPLSIEDAASPFTLLASGVPTMVEKPVADVINLSLGSTTGDPASATSRAANNAALAGTIVVASAGNSGEDGAATVGAPGAATLAIAVAASLDPGSVAGGGVLEADEIPADLRLPGTPGPAPETGAASEANAPNLAEAQGINLFPVAGGGPIPDGSLSAHYVFVDQRTSLSEPIPATPPTEVTNRIALVLFGGEVPQTFAQVANAVALLNPAAILLVTDTESATAVQVLNGIPTFTVSAANGQYLLALLDPSLDPGTEPEPGTISELPLRIAESVSLVGFEGRMAAFSSRGPNEEGGTLYPIVKPDVTAPGVGILGAATPDGLFDDVLGLANLTGYTQANGTSFSGPITAGAMVLIRQRVRDELGLDETDLGASDYRERRFDTVTVARALLQNSATNLRSGLGVPQDDGLETAAINDMGSGHINVAGALEADAIMVAPTILNDDNPDEYSPPEGEPAGDMIVLIPTASFGRVEIANSAAVDVRTQPVIIRDVAPVRLAGADSGSGTYTLSFQNNRNVTDGAGFEISFTSDEAGDNEITSVTVPTGGEATFYVRVEANGSIITTEPPVPPLTEPSRDFQWYVTATNGVNGQNLRMPFYYQAVDAAIPTAVTYNSLTSTPAANHPWLGLALAGFVVCGALVMMSRHRKG